MTVNDQIIFRDTIYEYFNLNSDIENEYATSMQIKPIRFIKYKHNKYRLLKLVQRFNNILNLSKFYFDKNTLLVIINYISSLNLGSDRICIDYLHGINSIDINVFNGIFIYTIHGSYNDTTTNEFNYDISLSEDDNDMKIAINFDNNTYTTNIIDFSNFSISNNKSSIYLYLKIINDELIECYKKFIIDLVKGDINND